MGLFEFFQRSEKESAERRRINIDRFQRGEESADTVQKGPVTVFHPKSFKDVEKIISTLKNGQQAVVHTGELAKDTAYRVLDMLCGAIYALDGGVYEMENNIFLFTPHGVRGEIKKKRRGSLSFLLETGEKNESDYFWCWISAGSIKS